MIQYYVVQIRVIKYQSLIIFLYKITTVLAKSWLTHLSFYFLWTEKQKSFTLLIND